MKEVHGEIKFDVSMNGSLVESHEKINEWTVGNRKLKIVDDYGNEIDELNIHNVEVMWNEEIE